MSDARLLTEQRGRVLVVQFTNPPRNFFDEQMAIELHALVREVDRDSSLGAVIFTGKDLFVTHYEVPDLLRGARGTPFKMSYRQARALGAYVRFLERAGWLHGLLRRTPMRDALTGAQTYRTLRRMNASDKVFIAAINGVALGMGAILALACDLRLMADGEDAAFGLIEQGISILAANGGTQRLVRMVGQCPEQPSCCSRVGSSRRPKRRPSAWLIEWCRGRIFKPRRSPSPTGSPAGRPSSTRRSSA